MAGRVRGNQVARWVINDLIDFSREKYVPKNLIAQLIALIAELEAFEDLGEVFDTLMCLRDDRRAEETKLADLNDLITQAKEETETKNTHVEMIEDASNDGWFRSVVVEVGASVAPYVELYGYASWPSFLK
ncbi:hypothetical protein Tco_0780368 [Tanacetum coccineum]